jgi:hypothetical protein
VFTGDILLTSMFFSYVSKKIALAWMLSKENSSHCPGGILADDQVIFISYLISLAVSYFTTFPFLEPNNFP